MTNIKRTLALVFLLMSAILALAQLTITGSITGSASSCSGTNPACVQQTLYVSPSVATTIATMTLNGTTPLKPKPGLNGAPRIHPAKISFR
jgi:hypothetical protein